MVDPLEDELKLSRQKREAQYRKITTDAEETPKSSSSSGMLKGRPVRQVAPTSRPAESVFNRVVRKPK